MNDPDGDGVAGELAPHRDERHGYSLPLPAGWLRLGPGQRYSLLAAEVREDDGFRSTVVVTVDDLPEGMGLRSWQQGIDEQLPALLNHYLLLDLEAVTLDGVPAVRRLAHHVVEGSQAVTVEQWVAVSGGRGYTLTATCHTLEYEATSRLFAAVAAGFRLPHDGDLEGTS